MPLADPQVVLCSNVQEAPCLDQMHADETVSWMVMEEGTWFSDDGAQIQVGKVQVGRRPATQRSHAEPPPNRVATNLCGAHPLTGFARVQAGVGGWTQVAYRGSGFAEVPVTLTTIQTFHGQSCHSDQGGMQVQSAPTDTHSDLAHAADAPLTECISGLQNRNDRQQCTSEQWNCADGTPMCQTPGTRDGGGDGYGTSHMS